MENDESVSVENKLLKSQTEALEQLLEVYEKSVLEITDELYAEIARRKQAEETLIRIKKAVESSGEAIGMSDPQGCHFYHNKAFHDLFEYSIEELNKPLAPVAIYADHEVGREVFETIMQGNPWVGEIIMVAKSGRRFPVFLRADAVKDDNGNIIGLIGIHTDITERKQAEEDLRESQEYTKVLFTSSHIPHIVMDAETGRFIDCNAAAAKISGYATREELIGKTSLDVSAPIQYNGLDSAIEVKKNDQACRENGSHLFEWRSQRANGQIWDAEIHLMVFQHRGKPLVQFILQDITERKRVEKALRESEKKLQAIINTTTDKIFLIDIDGIILAINKAAAVYLGLDPDRAVGATIFDGLTPEDVQKRKMSIQKICLAQQPFQVESKHRNEWTDTCFFPVVADGNVTGIVVYGRDITARKLAEEALEQSEERYRTIIEEMEEWYFESDLAGNIIFSNDVFADVLGYSLKELIGLNFRSFIKKEESDLVYKLFNQAFKAGKSTKNIPYEFIRTDGKITPAEFSIFPKRDKEGKVCGFKGVGHDITERRLAGEKIQYLATHDSLTGLPNRSMFSQLLNHAIQTAQRYQRQFAVLFIDLDRFKIVNDTLGHKAGDQLLQEIGTRLKQPLRAVDVVARLGGDEFVILIEEVNDSNQVATVAHKILTSIIKPITLMGQECRITASIGICMYPKDAENEQSIMKNADIAMYFAKEEGKNNYQFFSEDIKSKSLEHISIETNLRFALERNELSLQYQAKVDFKTNAITGVEALLRWQNPYLGSITPTQFIPVAEETGLIVSIGKWVLKTACAQNVAWQKQGLPAVCMAINLSLRQLTDDNLIDDIKTALNDSGMAPNLLELEITESMVMYNPERMASILAEIKSMGVRLAIDDFGTGYASLAHIKRFPVDTLKVDRSFIRNIPQDTEDRAITEAIIAMGKALNLTVVAEGVETAEQMNFLKEHSCDEMQGFYFSRPIMPEQFADLLRKHASAPLSESERDRR